MLSTGSLPVKGSRAASGVKNHCLEKNCQSLQSAPRVCFKPWQLCIYAFSLSYSLVGVPHFTGPVPCCTQVFGACRSHRNCAFPDTELTEIRKKCCLPDLCLPSYCQTHKPIIIIIIISKGQLLTRHIFKKPRFYDLSWMACVLRLLSFSSDL